MATYVIGKKRKVRFMTSSQRDTDDPDWYEWTVWVDDSRDGPKIKSIEYILHPTFPDRIRRKRNAAEQFRLTDYAWGEFDIHVNVHFEDGWEEAGIVPIKLK